MKSKLYVQNFIEAKRFLRRSLDFKKGEISQKIKTFLFTVASNLGISLSSGGGWAVVHTLQYRVLSVLRPNAQHSFLQGFIPQLLGGILEHTQLQHSPVLDDIVAGQADPSDDKSRIHGPAV